VLAVASRIWEGGIFSRFRQVCSSSYFATDAAEDEPLVTDFRAAVETALGSISENSCR
jgi:hypothetical protein